MKCGKRKQGGEIKYSIQCQNYLFTLSTFTHKKKEAKKYNYVIDSGRGGSTMGPGV